MKCVGSRPSGSVVVLLAGILCTFAPWSRAAEQLPPASEVLQRLLDRSQAVAKTAQVPGYTYEKRSLAEHLNAAGKPQQSEEKIYQVSLIAGVPFRHLVKIQGRELNGEQLKQEQRKEEAFRQKLSSTDARKMASHHEAWVTRELLDRYQFAVKERVNLSNRPTLVLTFKPRKGPLPEKTFRDKLLNRLEGTLWVDEAEADIANLSVRLTDSLSLGCFAVLGSLSRCDFSLERQRLPDGVWVEAKEALFTQFRLMTSTTRFRLTETCSGFRKVEGASTASPAM